MRQLIVPVNVGLRGKFRWQVLDERGVPEVPRNPSGFAIAPIEGVEQDNLILNQGIDAIFNQSLYSQSGEWVLGWGIVSNQDGNGDGWRRYLHAGTGSTAPNVADTTLVNETDRAMSSDSFPNGSRSSEWVSASNLYRCTSNVTRVVTMGANRNLTEIGLGHGNNTSVNIRSLLENGVGTPITVSLLAGKKLRVDHTVIAEAAVNEATDTLDIEEYDAADNLVGTVTVNVKHGLWVYNPSNSTVEGLYKYGLNPRATGFSNWCKSVGHLTSAQTFDTGLNITPAAAGTLTYEQTSYSAGSGERIFRATVAAGAANVAWHGYAFGHVAGKSGLLVCFTGGDTYTKKNTDTLRVGAKISWART